MLIRNLNLAKAGKYFDSNGSLNLIAGSNITINDDLAGNITVSSAASGTIDSAAIFLLIDSSYVQARQTPQDFAYSSLTGTPNVLDSTNVNTLITSAVNTLIDGAPGALDTLNELAAALGNDSNFAGTVTSAIAALPDSAEVATIIQSYGYTTYDSANATGQIIAALSTYVESGGSIHITELANYVRVGTLEITDATIRTDTGNTLDLTAGFDLQLYAPENATITTQADSSVSYTWDFQKDGNLDLPGNLIFQDASIQSTAYNTVAVTADINNVVDSSYVQARQDFAYSSLSDAPNVLDSTEVTSIITSTIDSTYVNNLPLNASTFNSQNPSYYLDYNNFNNTPNVLDSVNVSSIILSDVDSAYVQLRQTQQDFAYSSLTSTPNILDSADVTIVAKAAITAGTGISITDGVVSIGQSVGTTDSVTFDTITTTGDVVVGGNLQVNGTTTTVDAQSLEVSDNMIYMNAGESSGSPTAFIDVGWAANVNDQGSYYHVGLFRDATDQTFKVYHQYIPEPDSSVQIDTGHASFTLAPFAASTLTGEYLGFDSDFGLKTTDNLTQGSTNKYYSDTLVQTLVDSGYVQLRQTPQDFAYSSLTGTPNIFDSADVLALVAVGSADSATILGLVDSAYVQARQTPQDFAYSSLTGAPTNVSSFTNDANYLDSNTVTGVIDATYINSLVTATDSAAVINIITAEGFTKYDSADTLALIDSAYIQARQALGTDSTAVIDIITDTVDSAYVQARQTQQDFAYSSLTDTPNILDSGNVNSLVTAAINTLIDGAPDALNTLNELAAAINDDSNFAATVTTALGTKLNTADFTTTANSWLSGKSTSDLSEGSNLYYTTDRFDSDFNNNTTDDLSEGSNLYYTSARADSDFDVRLNIKTTTDIAEGSNLYYTTSRFDSDFNNNTTDDLSEGSNLYYITARADSDFDVRLATKSTDNLVEGTNLYFTIPRVETVIQSVVDNTYVRSRQDYAYSSLTGAPVVPDFAFTTINIVGQSNLLADSTADTLTLTAGTGISLTTDPGAKEVVISAQGVDSAATIAIINQTVDSAYVQLLQSYVGEVGIDSATAVNIARGLVDSAVNANTGITLNTFTGDASTVTFNTSYSTAVGAGDIIVAVDGIIQRPTTDYNVVSGNVVFTTAPDSDVTVSSRLVAGAGNHNWITVTNTSAANGNRLFVDCSSSAVTVQLPASPSYGDEIYIVDAEANAATNNITINRNGQKIDGVAEDLVVDVDGAAFILAYYNATRGWIFIGR